MSLQMLVSIVIEAIQRKILLIKISKTKWMAMKRVDFDPFNSISI